MKSLVSANLLICNDMLDLCQQDGDITELFDRLRSPLEQLCPVETVRNLSQCMDRLDFAGAMEQWRECQLIIETAVRREQYNPPLTPALSH